jgi:hypothetical protein
VALQVNRKMTPHSTGRKFKILPLGPRHPRNHLPADPA